MRVFVSCIKKTYRIYFFMIWMGWEVSAGDFIHKMEGGQYQ